MRFRAISFGQYMADERFRKSAILRKEDDGTVLSCALCYGKGRGQEFGNCPVCSTLGEVRVAEPFRRCRVCQGSGRTQRSSTYPCTVCRGKGAVTIPEEQEDCPCCGGMGKDRRTKLPCVKCRGIGAVARREQEASGVRS
jgi:DnaJ-class molecular chaperone